MFGDGLRTCAPVKSIVTSQAVTIRFTNLPDYYQDLQTSGQSVCSNGRLAKIYTSLRSYTLCLPPFLPVYKALNWQNQQRKEEQPQTKWSVFTQTCAPSFAEKNESWSLGNAANAAKKNTARLHKAQSWQMKRRQTTRPMQNTLKKKKTRRLSLSQRHSQQSAWVIRVFHGNILCLGCKAFVWLWEPAIIAEWWRENGWYPRG